MWASKLTNFKSYIYQARYTVYIVLLFQKLSALVYLVERPRYVTLQSKVMHCKVATFQHLRDELWSRCKASATQPHCLNTARWPVHAIHCMSVVLPLCS